MARRPGLPDAKMLLDTLHWFHLATAIPPFSPQLTGLLAVPAAVEDDGLAKAALAAKLMGGWPCSDVGGGQGSCLLTTLYWRCIRRGAKEV